MYEYKFEKILLNVPLVKDSHPVDDYQEIIHQYANDGWRLVQIFAPSVRNTGTASYFEMIFEREKK